MRSPGRNSVLLGLLVILAAGSLALKGAIGPTALAPPTTGPASVANRLVTILSSQGFVTSVRRLKIQSSIVFARRGTCTLSVRDAFGGPATEALFAQDARHIGQVRYFYRGDALSAPPTLRIHLAVIEASLFNSLGFARNLHVPLAFAASPQCGSEAFGLQDLQLTV